MAIIGTFTKRLRCEIQGCHKPACYGLGRKHNDFMLCDVHFNELVKDINELNAEVQAKAKAEAEEQKKLEAEAKAKAKAEAKAAKEEAVVEEVKEEVKEEAVETVETPHEFFTCKYCGNQFDKAEYTTALYMAHCRKCKKEHEA